MNANSNNQAICYVGFGEFYLCQALLSIKSLKKIDNISKVVLVTNVDFDTNKFSFWDQTKDEKLVFTDALKTNRNYKTNIDKYINAEKVAYFDSDTIVLSNFDLAWSFLDYFDILLKLNSSKQKRKGKGDILILNNQFRVNQLPHFNGGMFFFKKTPYSKEFFRLWNKSFKKYNSPYDQISLNEALFESNVRILPLTNEWNYFPDLNYYKGKSRNPIIFHYTNRISYVLENELMKIAEIAEFNKKVIKQKIIKRRLERKKKIGRLEWFKLRLLWIIMYNNEKKRLNLF